MTEDNGMKDDANKSDLRASAKKQFDLLADHFKRNKRYVGHLSKKTKLKELNLKNKSLVDAEVAKQHARKLEKRVLEFVLKHKSEDRTLRWVTLLDSVVDLDIETVMDRVKFMTRMLKEIQQQLSEIHMIGAFELEIVNLDFNDKHASAIGRDKLEESTRNKILVLEQLASTTSQDNDFGGLAVSVKGTGSKVLVHIHAIADFGKNTESNIEKFTKKISEISSWNRNKTQLHIEKFYSTNPLVQNIANLCDYMTKSGNEELKYKVFYGRDRGEMTIDEQESAMYKFAVDGNGRTRQQIRVLRNAMYDEIAYENVRHLTHEEIRFLNDATYELMISSRRNTKEGYLFLV